MAYKAFAFPVFAVLGMLAGCTSFNRLPLFHEPLMTPHYPSASNATRTIDLSPFNQIVIRGNMHVLINGHRLKNELRVTGVPNQQNNVTVRVDHGILYLTNSHDLLNVKATAPAIVDVDVAGNISQISDRGEGELVTKNIGDRNLTLYLHGSVKAQMTGNIVFQKILVGNQSTLHAYWVNSTHLYIRAFDQAKVLLAGVATHVDIEAYENAAIDGRYLRASEGFVRTGDNADVALTVTHGLSTFSTGNSSVYYYRDPSFFTSHTLQSAGSALRMQGIPVATTN